MNVLWKSVILLLSAALGVTEAASMCSDRNFDPCVTFSELCSIGGATCRFKAPCEYECVCPQGAIGCTGSQGSSGNSNVQPHESESLLVFSPNLFDDFPQVNQPPATATNSTASPPTTTTASISTSAAAVVDTTGTTSAPTTSTPSTTTSNMLTTASTTTTTKTITSADPVAAAAMVERRQVMLTNDALDDFEPVSQTFDNDTGNAPAPQQDISPSSTRTPMNNAPQASSNNAPQASSNNAPQASSNNAPQVSEQNLFAEKASKILTATSAKQEIQQILENIKSSFQLLTSHILGAENRSSTTTMSSPPLASSTPSFAASSLVSADDSQNSTSFAVPSSPNTKMKTA